MIFVSVCILLASSFALTTEHHYDHAFSAYLKDPEGMKKKIAAGYASGKLFTTHISVLLGCIRAGYAFAILRILCSHLDFIVRIVGSVAAPSSPAPSTTHTIKPAMPSPPVANNLPPQPAAVVAPPQPQQTNTPSNESSGSYGVTDMSNDDGPAYDGQGGFGLARGTKNTYVIPGMDEMSPEEYRQKLQESISARQAKRREEAIKSGVIGNRSSNGYLDTLGQQGESNDEFDADNEVMMPGSKKAWRSDSVRSWMEALGRVEREIESNLDFDEDLLEDESQDMNEEELNMIAVQQREIEDIIAGKSQPSDPSSEQLKSVLQQHESVIEFASSLKQGREEKEISRKSEWQTEITDIEREEIRHIEAETKDPEVPALLEEKQWFNEKRQRPIPTSDRPKYATVEKYIGDASKKSVSDQRLDRGWYNEKRVRPIPNSDPGQRPTVTDRTGAQSDRKATKLSDSLPASDGIWYDEKRVRPVPNSDPAERPKITDRTGAKQDRKSTKVAESQSASDGVWYDEKRVRPVPNSDPADRPTVSERTGAQQNRQSAKASDSQQQASDVEDTWHGEKRVRPAPNSDPAERPKVADRTGAELEVNKKANKTSKSSSSEPEPDIKKNWYNESRARPIPNTESPEHPKVYDRTGAESDATPKGPLRNSLLRSLLNDEPPNRTKVSMQTSDKTTVSSGPSEINQWWKDNINRPKDYAVRSNAPLNNTYEKRREPEKNYGDMKLELSDQDEGDE